MPLIDCPQCGKSVSDEARACPNCGHPIAETPAKSRRAMIGTIVAVGAVGGIFFLIRWAQCRNSVSKREALDRRLGPLPFGRDKSWCE